MRKRGEEPGARDWVVIVYVWRRENDCGGGGGFRRPGLERRFEGESVDGSVVMFRAGRDWRRRVTPIS